MMDPAVGEVTPAIGLGLHAEEGGAHAPGHGRQAQCAPVHFIRGIVVSGRAHHMPLYAAPLDERQTC